MDQTLKKSKTPEQALTSLMRLCARREYCTSDVGRLLVRWGVEPTAHNGVVERLTRERFIDDRRYTEAFVREKLKLSSWGAFKITSTLRAKRISADIISEVLDEYSDRDTQTDRLRTALTRKLRNIKYKDHYDLRAKLMRYGASLGHDFESVAECVDQLLKDHDTEQD
ncbi:MAG: RecX family transcriptional regulator [Rikenellaceae bacterium]|nr:RecX family transcriptional regulator [Rikenellaceae bacterium]